MNAVVGIAGLEKLSRHYLDLYRSLRIDTARLESDVRPDSADAAPRIRQLYRTLTDLSNNQALELADLAGPHPSEELAAAFRATDLQRRILLQSAFIRRALEKPRGYAGDMELMLMICKRGDVGENLFARLLNRFYLDLPASRAVRQRVHLLTDTLANLPDEAQVLNLACGPALEVHNARQAGHSNFHVDLVDHDSATLEYLDSHLEPGARTLLKGNAFRLMAGDPRVQQFAFGAIGPAGSERLAELSHRYDLVYSSGLYDYRPAGDGRTTGAAVLTRHLFDLVEPGGRLLIGNFLTPLPRNPHGRAHRLMMEWYSDWRLRYRSPTEIEQLTRGLPPGSFTCDIVDEKGFPMNSSCQGTIGFLDIRRAR